MLDWPNIVLAAQEYFSCKKDFTVAIEKFFTQKASVGNPPKSYYWDWKTQCR